MLNLIRKFNKKYDDYSKQLYEYDIALFLAVLSPALVLILIGHSFLCFIYTVIIILQRVFYLSYLKE